MMTMMTMTTMKKKSVWLGFKKNGVVLYSKKSYAGEVESNNWAVKPPQV